MSKENHDRVAGLSGMSLYVPAPRVSLEAWCGWTGNAWDKTRSVVGKSFRCPAPHENVYTMAATAALRLIQRYDVDPARVGYLALGTESSTDNSAGAVIVRGMLDRKLEELGLGRLSRELEVPEFKHACLGGIYALKAALRYVRCDGAGRQAIVLCADVAEYERGSSGEPTQGAGAVAMLVEREPLLCAVDLERAASASDYRGPDFRKPFMRHFVPGYAPAVRRLHDFPVFSGKYSTYAYLDETAHAVERMVERAGLDPLRWLEQARALFFHRPYHLMPVQALAFLYARALARTPGDRAELCALAGVPEAQARAEAASSPDLFGSVLDSAEAPNPYPALTALAGQVRKSAAFARLLADKMSLGSELCMDLGNLYTAALPAWLAAGFEEAYARGVELADAPIVAVGYGSGDAAEALPLRAVPGWQAAAARLGVREALEPAMDLDRAQYEALHDSRDAGVLPALPGERFTIARLGDRCEPAFQDVGVEYYAYGA
jgi:hydroxymethylglutaryl-CoA synthase